VNRNPHDPAESLAKLFGDTARPDKGESTLFGDASAGRDPRSRLHASIVRLRILRGQAGSDGLTPAATRSLLDEVLKALEAIVEALPATTDSKGDSGAP
jgi:hypothetical protein